MQLNAWMHQDTRGVSPAQFDWQSKKHLARTLSAIPPSFRAATRAEYKRSLKTSLRAANLYAGAVFEQAESIGVPLTSDRETMREWARVRTDAAQAAIMAGGLEAGLSFAESCGVPAPNGQTDAGQLARLLDDDWWYRALRKRQARAIEEFARNIGVVNRIGQCYVSNDNLRRWQAAQHAGREWLESQELVSEETGEVLGLASAADSTTANPELRKNELMTRIAGFEEFAKQNGHAGEFYTITTPSRYHAYSVIKNKQGRVVAVRRNARFDGSTPRDGQGYLCKVWARIRAKLHRMGVGIYGFRVAEPHHDGTPHWHLLLFMDRADRDAVRRVMRAYALQDSPNEPGAASSRFEAVAIDWTKGSAAGYIAKYISKNITGEHVNEDFDSGLDAATAADRVRAWSSVWAIRQFQQIGGAAVTVWREARRIKEPLPDGGLPEQLRAAADAGQWRLFCSLLGGCTAKRKEQPAWLHKLPKERNGEPVPNKYGEFIDKIYGLVAFGLTLQTREDNWIIRPKTATLKR